MALKYRLWFTCWGRFVLESLFGLLRALCFTWKDALILILRFIFIIMSKSFCSRLKPLMVPRQCGEKIAQIIANRTFAFVLLNVRILWTPPSLPAQKESPPRSTAELCRAFFFRESLMGVIMWRRSVFLLIGRFCTIPAILFLSLQKPLLLIAVAPEACLHSVDN